MHGLFVADASSRGTRFLLTFLLALAIEMATPIWAESVSEPATHISQLYRLGEREQRANCSFRLEGVVCAAAPEANYLVVRDSSGDLEVQLDLAKHPVQPGQKILLEGCGVMKGNRLILNQVPAVDNDGIHGMVEASSPVLLKAGKQPLRLLWFNGEGGFGLEAYYEGPELSRQRIPGSALFREQVDPATGSTNLVNGLNYRYFEGGEGASWKRLPDFNRLKPLKTGTVTNFDLSVIINSNSVGAEFTGYVEVPRDGLYTFSTISDDGSELFVGELPPYRLEVVGSAPVPAPHPIMIAQAMSAEAERRWSEVKGTVTFVNGLSDGFELELSSGDRHMAIRFPGDSSIAPAFLLNSQIQVRGFCRNTYSLESQKAANAMTMPSWNQVELLQVAAEHWMASPLASVGDLLTNHFAWTNGTIVRVQGTLSATVPDQPPLVEDKTGQIFVEGIRRLPQEVAAPVELLGKVTRTGTRVVLENGHYRPLVSSSGTNMETLPLLTSAQQVHYLSRAEASRKYPVRIRGVVTSSMVWHLSFVLQDNTHGIFVDGMDNVTGRQRDIGEYLEVEGVSDPSSFAPVVIASRVIPLGTGQMPAPIHPNRDQMLNGSLDGQYVEVQGVVTAVEPGAVTLLTLIGKYRVLLLEMPYGDYQRFENALIRIKGCLYASWDTQTQLIKIGEMRIFNGSINVDEPAPADLFAAPAKSPSELLRFDAKASALKRVKVTGQIVHAQAGECLLMNGTNGLRLLPRTPVQLRAGDNVTVVGFPELGGASPILREAVVRQTGWAPLPPTQHLTADNLLRAECDSTLVEIESQLVGMRTNQAEQVLELQTGPRTFLARLDREKGFMPPVPLGSLLKLRGAYAGRGGDQAEGRSIDSFELLLNSPADITVLKRPAWWTPQRALTMVGVLVGGLLLAATWISGLRRQVGQRTGQLKEEIEEHKRSETRLAGEIEERKRIELEVERIHRQLVDTSRQAGQAEVASSVLHNVGNVLNSVNVSAGIIVDRVRASKSSQGVVKLAELLASHQSDLTGFLAQDGRSEHVVKYLQGIAKQVGSEQANLLGELDGITKNIDHIKEIVAMQQSYARVSGVLETQSLSALVEDALRMHATSLTRHEVSIIRQFDPIPDILLDKHKVLQILVNLITNAKWALGESTAADRVLALRVCRNPDNMVQVSVADNGIGISPENLARIFTHGFTTRPNGHGFGLHSGILAAKEMGGTLSVQSEGLGKGAIFTLELPCRLKEGTV